MKSDLSRDTFDRARHYSAVRLQQGRIVTDADWNEQADIARYRSERQARDTIGPCGAPLDAAGYGLAAETNSLAVRAVNANVAWVVAEDGALLSTSNGGADWTLVDLATSAHLRAIAQAGNAGWIVGDGGVVRKTSDAGLTWTAQDAGTLSALRGVAAVDADHAWAVGDGGIVVATVDGGVHWSLVQTQAARLDAVAFVDALNGLAVGRAGTIVSTNDGGETWSDVQSGTVAHLRALARVGTTRAWAAGQDGTIVRSVDGGVTWLPSGTPTVESLHAIAFRDAVEGWAVGERGTVLHSVDGGATWQEDDVGIGTATLRGLSVFGSEPAWTVGDGVAALRLGIGSPETAEVALPAVNLSIEPGRYYVNGVLCELETRTSYAHQADGGAGVRLGPGAYLMYLDVWERSISALETPAIREVALGGPDTATRARTIAQVRALPLPASSPFDWNCDSSIEGWDALVGMSRPRLAARAEPQLAAANLCEIAATAGYRRLENQLYRVEVHEGGAHPSFKWSRENGSVAYAVAGITTDSTAQQTTVRVAARGRDANLDLAVHDRVELVDDDSELTQRAGAMFEYLADGDDELELVLAGLPTGALGRDPMRHPVLRRWDHKPAVAGTNVLPIVEGSWIGLEDGVQVRFEPGGLYRPGDYWQIPARTITADVEWPRDDDGDPVAREPAGIVDAYCRLGIVEVDASGTVTVAGDCRELFPPLTALEQLLYVSGDGQDAAPNALLPQPLALRVARGTVPVAGARVRFEVESGDGLVGDGVTASPSRYDTTTDDAGLVTCRWTLGAGSAAPGRYQRVHASLLDADGQALPGQDIVYCATATMVLQYVSGDGQQASAGANLRPIEVRVANGGDGVAGVTLTASIEQGGGTIVGPANVSTDPQGYASIGWRLGSSGAQRLAVRLAGENGAELQRLAFNANIAVPAAAGGGCAITIGRDGQIQEPLTAELLTKLLKQGNGRVCLCFLADPPKNQKEHVLDALKMAGNPDFRIAIHGCGNASVIRLRGVSELTGFGSVEISDLSIVAEENAGINFVKCQTVRVTSVTAEMSTPSAKQPLLGFASAQAIDLSRNTIATKMPGLAIVFEDALAAIQLNENRIAGILSFYGAPDGPVPQIDLAALDKVFTKVQLAASSGRLFMSNNAVDILTIGARKVAEIDAVARGTGNTLSALFQSAVLQGNTLPLAGHVFLSRFLTLGTSAFLAESQILATFIAEGCAIVGNVATAIGDNRTIVVYARSFAEAGNAVFILRRAPGP
jgi:photosystem II stability/assembly factor-like uncharacterized protein